ncbi:Cmx/CmrA family chloramphenicol efflux MFS transporter [Glycomyces terrestris]|uniref:MFS transporter n=1 Tax=Glycomyces terrestris TaxID=2493553 RepID=A0A426UVY4_9ACTN|nr:Cmx/CmrA family chloramphenicol efflux MFS transporter [Glycomyces terrestris]RRR98506.1 MFS transporter [Glycomyces terrestris]
MPLVLYLLAVAVFAQGSSEFMLAGLLPAIAAELGVTIAEAGLLTSAFAAGMVAGAPLMAAAGRRWPPRAALTAFLALFIAAHVTGALTDDFAVLLATRVAAALANAGFLAVALATVALLVPETARARALAVLLGGTTLALVAGVPAGAVLGEALGWRAALWAVAALAAPALAAVALAAPDRPAAAAPLRLGTELAVLKRPEVLHVLALGVLVNGGTFGAYTYLGALAGGRAALALALFGAGAFLGVAAAGRLADRHWRRLLAWGGPLLLAGWAALALAPGALLPLAPVLGALAFGTGSTLIGRIMAAARDAPTMGGSYATAALNVGATAGPVLAGLGYEQAGPAGSVLAAAALTAGAIALAALRRP